ncbi:hypothetical protein JTE90_009188 [Oedothorax gibbosus]|uniref:RING-type E3 ubiquitin transferase n=1 Tax=Oedothorax gibbosus TaxID=931172 RepID=A0AAV6UWU5_9ARAC|nr:hypothetical protein JTE90_009188 [Oedothorax gibbosus]
MAEALQLESFNSKYFCHHCTREFGHFHTAELICPGCSSDFLEIVSKEFYEAENLPSMCDEYESSSEENETESDELLISELSMERLLSQMLLNVAENLPPEPSDASDVPPPDVPVPPQRPSMFSTDSYIPSNIVMDVGMFDRELSTADERLRSFDWNVDEEIDALASQLLDEIEVSGPPPLSKEQIKSLCTVKVEEKHTEKELQCTVCMEDLKLNDKVKQLPCDHFYHEKCITPWLERQSTCPNCRQVIQVETKSKNSKRSKSCPRARMHLRSGNSRRFSEASSISEFFTTSMNPFRYIN